MTDRISNVAAIRQYFADGKHGRKVEMQELKELTMNAREELGELCRQEL